MWKKALQALALSWPALSFAAAPLAVATVVDGEAVLVRGASTFALAEGVRLEKDDILQTPAKGRFIRVEFSDGTMLDLGPDSLVILAPKVPPARLKPAPRLYLLSGVAKLSAPSGGAPLANGLASPAFDMLTVARDVVLGVTPAGAQAFAESGGVTLAERRDLSAQAPVTLKTGQFFSRTGESRGQVSARPTGAFVQSLPRAFLDTLPSRADKFKSRDVAPRKIGEIAYTDAQPWIDAEPALRPLFLVRWRALALQPEFRKPLSANIAAHPEWDRTLFPEKYRPKPAPGDTPRRAAGQ